ncbi:tRNA pseudouridine synthase A [Paenarthrobacter ureafaciens]|uniref:tRNA pseudouridine synthase A n=1 Tax=Paenarthrobacter TaxID=1742992 RepID=UPI0008A6D6DB|nr:MULTISPECIES: tRNA pseudouridine synthase A [Paenarthrobacter]AOY70326.1 tRNA pseudouridine synthase A [Arthrobacter sp. ZXY-2]MCW3765891.1 tRNA pseudouridine synthase A [Paenarthrobacter sp. PAE-2]QOT16255.1 tRNA pseudouridine(38-40) synthase TruA [Paenarthrobacter sp. YJN-5]
MNEQKPAAPVSEGGGFLRIRMDLSYDGGPFNGWAVQPGLLTVQGALEEALALLVRRPVRVTVAGRTDAGVHARGQVVHIDFTSAEWLGLTRGHDVDPAVSLQRRLRGALSRVLGDLTGAIEVHDAGLAPEGFDARFSALWRRYSYRIADGTERWDPVLRGITLWHKAPLDVSLMNSGASLLLGLQDFRSYCKPREGATTIRELQQFSFSRGADGIIVATVQADAFCHNMVRSLVGSTLRVGEGLEPPEWLHERLLERARDPKSLLAAPHPLVLEEVAYPSDDELLARAELTRARRE